jgi:hypothetical protein
MMYSKRGNGDYYVVGGAVAGVVQLLPELGFGENEGRGYLTLLHAWAGEWLRACEGVRYPAPKHLQSGFSSRSRRPGGRPLACGAAGDRSMELDHYRPGVILYSDFKYSTRSLISWSLNFSCIKVL